ncbi:hypothetical protein HMI54_000248 [Coelomomyces lativittatus]|nr:hypothetical protein HMI54_000248 [Coelomomyces lativittatus]KAJ1513665.1 hypothetical protein HMI55_005337 [Coelomomyces lativittatus]
MNDALELLDITNNNNPKSITLDRHPERRHKRWLAFRERELPSMRKENPTLKLTQLNDRLWKIWQKHPENPFNQVALAYNATLEIEKEAIQMKKEQKLNSMRRS